MNQGNEQILERIRTLLAMAADTSSPHEASIAAGRARKLMDQHQVELEDLKESNGFGFQKVDKEYRFMPQWKSILSVAIAELNDCTTVLAHTYKSSNRSYAYQIVYQGFEADVAVAVAMYDYLTQTVDRLCQRYIEPLGYTRYPAKLGDAYKKGASLELCRRLREILAQRTAEVKMSSGTSLVVFKMAQVEAEFGKPRYKDTKLVSRAGMDVELAKYQGGEDAKRISLASQLGDAAVEPSRGVG